MKASNGMWQPITTPVRGRICGTPSGPDMTTVAVNAVKRCTCLVPGPKRLRSAERCCEDCSHDAAASGFPSGGIHSGSGTSRLSRTRCAWSICIAARVISALCRERPQRSGCVGMQAPFGIAAIWRARSRLRRVCVRVAAGVQRLCSSGSAVCGPDVSGSEAVLCLSARGVPMADSAAARVVGMPSWGPVAEQRTPYRAMPGNRASSIRCSQQRETAKSARNIQSLWRGLCEWMRMA